MLIHKSCSSRSNFGLVLFVASLLLASAPWTFASELHLANSSFESPALSPDGKQATNQFADWKITEFTASYISGSSVPKGALRVLISVGEPSAGGKGDWTVDNVRLDARRVEAPSAAISKVAAPPAAGVQKARPVSAKSNAIRYNRDIRPILSENCFACHGPDSASRKAKLRLDRYDDAVAARKGSPAITPGK